MKVLIISHNPITTYQNMGKTMLSLFSAFRKDELCQLYIYPTLPDVDVCASYFQITDRNVLKSYLHFGKVNTEIIASKQIGCCNGSFYESANDEKFMSRKKTPLLIIARDLIWKYSHWYNKKLKDWLIQEHPDRIFIAPGEGKFLYDVGLKISHGLNIPIVTYVCDEFYFVEPTKAFCGRLQLHLLKAKIRQLMTASSQLITICDKLAVSYSKEFSVPATTIYTGTNFPIIDNPQIQETISGITYLGNLANNRLDALLDVGRALQQINVENQTNYKVFLYTRVLTEEQKQIISQVPSIEYRGYVMGEEYEKVLHNADLLLHVEAFDEESINRVKHSISTKIADSLGSGVPLLAYGSMTVVSISYLNEFIPELVASSKSELIPKITGILSFIERKKVSAKEICAAKQNHNSEINSKKLYAIIGDAELFLC